MPDQIKVILGPLAGPLAAYCAVNDLTAAAAARRAIAAMLDRREPKLLQGFALAAEIRAAKKLQKSVRAIKRRKAKLAAE